MSARELKGVINLANRIDAVAKATCGNIYNGTVAICAEEIVKSPNEVIDFLLTIIEREEN